MAATLNHRLTDRRRVTPLINARECDLTSRSSGVFPEAGADVYHEGDLPCPVPLFPDSPRYLIAPAFLPLARLPGLLAEGSPGERPLPGRVIPSARSEAVDPYRSMACRIRVITPVRSTGSTYELCSPHGDLESGPSRVPLRWEFFLRSIR